MIPGKNLRRDNFANMSNEYGRKYSLIRPDFTNPYILFTIFFLIFFLVSLTLVGVKVTILFVLTLILFSLPGFPLAILICGWPSILTPFPILLGFSIGMIISCLINNAVVRIIGWNFQLTILLILVVTALGWVYLKKKNQKRHLLATQRIPFEYSDYLFLLVMGSFMLIVLSVPLSRVGHISGSEHLYYSLFSHDYLGRGAYAYELLRGVPSKNIFAAGYDFRYYFLSYTFFAFMHSITGGQLAPNIFILASTVWFTMLFLLGLMFCTKAFIRHRVCVYLAVSCGLIFYSYNSIYTFMKRIVAPNIPTLRTFLESRGLLEYTDISHGWYRNLLFEPQAILALVFFLSLLSLVKIKTFREIRSVSAWTVGVLLAGINASDTTIGIISVLWFGACAMCALMTEPHESKVGILKITVHCYSVALFFFIMTIVVGLISVQGSGYIMHLKPYRIFWFYCPAYFFIEYGPLFIFGVLGIWALLKRKIPFSQDRNSYLLFSLAASCIFVIAFLQLPRITSYDYFARKSAMVLEIPLMIFTGFFFEVLLAEKNKRKIAKWIAVCVSVSVFGFATLIIDFAAFAGFYDAGETSKISLADFEACSWIRKNTPLFAVIQSLPEYSTGYYKMSPVAFIGGRRMALGNLKIGGYSFPSRGKFKVTKNEMLLLFETADIQKAINVIDKHSIDYVYIGPHERNWSSDGVKKYYDNPNHFKLVYSKMGVDIFRYYPAGQAVAVGSPVE
jgi:hypothetical protein